MVNLFVVMLLGSFFRKNLEENIVVSWISDIIMKILSGYVNWNKKKYDYFFDKFYLYVK